jgi:hypothetical protein
MFRSSIIKGDVIMLQIVGTVAAYFVVLVQLRIALEPGNNVSPASP